RRRMLSSQRRAPGGPFGSGLRRLLGHVCVQRLGLFTLLRKLGEARFLRRLVRRQRQMVGMQGLILLAKPFRFRFQAVPFGGSPAGPAELGLLISLSSSHPLVKRDKLSQELLAPYD